ncbi:hypothetical protein B5M42_018030 [Paenibacillus athensensis]|uniref:Uncharacterized protein n=1 Tax=Paenibacillus athensensis TaxID=1967502 RepID=A0A4Y8Q1A5_9BACL|nr:hypothetical protein [Paenibacillus athensensis]MCD1260703.1 hypothetical protein [Paenibacillus athensensis]
MKQNETSQLKTAVQPAEQVAAPAVKQAAPPNSLAAIQRSLGNRGVAQLVRSHTSSAASSSVQREETTGEQTEQEEPENAATAPVAASGEDTRTKEQKEADLAEAVNEANEIVKSASSIAEVESFFPQLTKDFGLTHIGWTGLGTPSAALDIKINPAAQIDINTLELNTGDLSHSTMLTQQVDFTTGALGGDTVGMKMVATRLGPNHPQGGPPQGAALRTIMGQLPTDPTYANTDKFIKGHLLNDNLGGPGTAANLFPITAEANKQHEQFVESWAKEWVNEKGYWVYYEVEIQNITEDLKPTTALDDRYVNADIVTTLAKLDATGKRTTGTTHTIESRFGGGNAPASAAVAAEGGAAMFGAVDPGFDPSKVEWSTSKGDPTQPLELKPSLRNTMQMIRTRLDALDTFTQDGVKQALRIIIPNIGDIHRDVLTDPDFSMHNLNGEPVTQLQTWNKAIRQLNETAGLEGVLTTFSLEIMGISIGIAGGAAKPRSKAAIPRKAATEAKKTATVNLVK